MSLIQLQELNGQYLEALTEGLHKLLEVAAANRHYKDVSVISAALESLKAQENVVEIGYRSGEIKVKEFQDELKTQNINEDSLVAYIETFLKSCFESLPEGKTVSSYILIGHTECYLEANWRQALNYGGCYTRTFWKVCFEKAIVKLLADNYIKKLSRYVYAPNKDARSD